MNDGAALRRPHVLSLAIFIVLIVLIVRERAGIILRRGAPGVANSTAGE
jgi:hypothetical protein